MNRFVECLLARRRAGYVPVIPDFKRISPADGPLFSGRNVLRAAEDMERAGAPASLRGHRGKALRAALWSFSPTL